MKLYLDVCCLNRPFDDQSQNRVRLEAEAVLSILELAGSGALEIIGSDIIDDGFRKCPTTKGVKKSDCFSRWLHHTFR